MKYLCLGYLDREAMDSRPKAEIERIMAQCQPHMEAIGKTGQMLMVAGLEPETKGLRRSKGKIVVTDGPFTETKELLGSVFIVEAQDMAEAVRVAFAPGRPPGPPVLARRAIRPCWTESHSGRVRIFAATVAVVADMGSPDWRVFLTDDETEAPGFHTW